MRTAAADTATDVRAEELAAADSAAAATVVEAAEGAADVTRGEDEAAATATYSVLSDAAALRRWARMAVTTRMRILGGNKQQGYELETKTC